VHVRTRLAFLAIAAVALSACGETTVFSLSVGECFQDDAAGAAEVTDVETVDCDEPHDNEVFHTFELGGDEYPSDDEIIAAIEEECLDPTFADYFGEPYETSEIEIFPITPTAESWEEVDDREVVCAGYIEGERVEGSLQGSGR
jgi:hypothetical protein